jgi:hypothetical protein
VQQDNGYPPGFAFGDDWSESDLRLKVEVLRALDCVLCSPGSCRGSQKGNAAASLPQSPAACNSHRQELPFPSDWHPPLFFRRIWVGLYFGAV